MHKQARVAIVGLLWLAWPAAGQLPEFYKSVDRITWVVEDLDRAVQGWTKLGFSGIEDRGEVDLESARVRGKPAAAHFRWAAGRLGEVAVDWVQPLSGENAFSEFLARHGSGVFSLIHRVPSMEAFDTEVARLGKIGVAPLQTIDLDFESGTVRIAYMDTEPQGKYGLGLIAGEIEASPLAVAAPGPGSQRITQYAFAVKELEPVSKFWAGLGFPAMNTSRPQMRELRYKDQPGDFDMILGWQRHGKVPYEFIQSVRGSNVYLDHMARHGEGVHHIAFNVSEMDKEVARWNDLGFAYSMGGAWGEKDKPGSGRFVYLDTQAIGGTDVELLWNYKP